MNRKNVLLASLLAASSFVVQSAQAAPNWIGTADYTAGSPEGDEDVVGPFSTYDFGTGVVLLETTSVVGNVSTLNGYFQSFVTNHELNSVLVLAANLNTTYELTVVANFSQTTTQIDPNTASTVIQNGGSFTIYRDTYPDRDYTTDSGFTNGEVIMSGTVTGGGGVAATFGSAIFGANDITVQVTSFDAAVFDPDTIATADGIFTLRLGNSADASFLSDVPSVLGNTADAGDYKFAADGYATLAVPEAETYAMMLVGLGLVGFMVRRRTRLLA
ncbi:MAG: flocculation-associated PEP-CTERM protein PepA [Thiobacillus sp.]|uniref:flocculation-associated PEP-CTERM protein PepA n=1 Tax=Thiobacillus sp. TaxID=924 RepID=UPI002732CDAC|nr:flocculation-associated PEP-CTERM protein PepA [Thiobacillus sp.]MDP3584465.1 flocculation-associated PEP-CTERM protein PepA [Thiobacillus sp.]